MSMIHHDTPLLSEMSCTCGLCGPPWEAAQDSELVLPFPRPPLEYRTQFPRCQWTSAPLLLSSGLGSALFIMDRGSVQVLFWRDVSPLRALQRPASFSKVATFANNGLERARTTFSQTPDGLVCSGETSHP